MSAQKNSSPDQGLLFCYAVLLFQDVAGHMHAAGGGMG